MKKKIMALVLCAAMSVSMLTACGSDGGSGDGETGETYTMKMHLSIGETDPVYKSAEVFAQTVNEKTNGAITVELYPSSSLGNTADCLEGLSLGICNIVYESIGNLASLSSLANIEAAPYLYSGVDHWRAVWEGEVGQDILNQMGEECGMVILGAGLQGIRVMCSNKRIESPADAAGFKLRVPTIPIYLDPWEWLGASPTPLAITETYTAIQQGTVEGQENPISECWNYGFYDVNPYWIKSNHVYSQDCFFMDKTFFDGLPADIQELAAKAADEASSWRNEQMVEFEAEVEQKALDAGVTIVDVDVQEFIDAFDGFMQSEFPDLVDWADQIAAMADTAAADPAEAA